jgi:hypothetical protein
MASPKALNVRKSIGNMLDENKLASAFLKEDLVNFAFGGSPKSKPRNE